MEECGNFFAKPFFTISNGECDGQVGGRSGYDLREDGARSLNQEGGSRKAKEMEYSIWILDGGRDILEDAMAVPACWES